MATDLTSTDAQVPAPVAQHAAPAPKSSAPHRWRFFFIYGTLAAVLGLAIVGVIVYAGRSISPAPKWSAWQPSGGGLGAAKQIAQHVGGTYHLPAGQQLVDVIAQPPLAMVDAQHQAPIQFIALRGLKGVVDNVVPIDSSNTVTYSLCGGGAGCSIATGTATADRFTLVRREILELSLYTFKYVGGVDNIVAFTPPTPKQQSVAIFLQRNDLTEELKHPLTETLNAKVPTSTISPQEQEAIDLTTQSREFAFKLLPGQQGNVILSLQRIA